MSRRICEECSVVAGKVIHLVVDGQMVMVRCGHRTPEELEAATATFSSAVPGKPIPGVTNPRGRWISWTKAREEGLV